MNASTLISGQSLACLRGGRHLFSGVSIDVQPGHALVVMGRNGAGKSSLLRLLAGLGTSAQGHITRNAALCFMGHDTALKATQTVHQELVFWRHIHGSAPQSVAQAVAAMCVEDLLTTPCGRLSAGQKRRVALARVMASDRLLWILDEPTVGLDAPSIHKLEQALITHLRAGGGVIAATHHALNLPSAHILNLPCP